MALDLQFEIGSGSNEVSIDVCIGRNYFVRD
jgi:hypothetical protein